MVLAKKVVITGSKAVKSSAQAEPFDRYKYGNREKDGMTIKGTSIIELHETELEEERRARDKSIT